MEGLGRAQPARYHRRVPATFPEIRQFTPRLVPNRDPRPPSPEAAPGSGSAATEPDARTRAWCQAVSAGFHDHDPSEAGLRRIASAAQRSGALLTEVRADTTSPDPALADRPVGTFSVFDGLANLGAGQMVPAGLITGVTVRPTHKRRGLLRAMMTLNLAQLAARDVPLALLTASNAQLYGRYGFQTVVRESRVTVSPGPGFSLRTPTTGRVEVVTMGWLLPRMPQVFDRYHRRMRGSTTRYEGYYEDLYHDPKADRVDGKFVAAVHIDDTDNLDGYVTFEIEGSPALKVRELVAATPAAELALWDHLNRVELIKEIVAPTVPEDSLLPLALVDQRSMRTTSVSDALWARVLDPVQVLDARPYTVAARGAHLQVAFAVEDELGHASGAYRVVTAPEGVQVTRLAGPESAPAGPDIPTPVRLTVQALSALAFGSATASDLAGAQMISGAGEGELEVMDALFAPVGRAGFMSHF